MKSKFFGIALLVCALSLLTGCSRIGPGHVGIKIDMAGNNKGVLNTPVRTGWVFYSPFSSSVIEYPTNIQTAKWTKNPNEGSENDESVTFTNKDSMTINADISLSYSLIADDVPKFYVKFLTDDLDKFTHGFLRNVARDCLNEHAGKYAVEQIMGDNAPFLKDTRECIQTQMQPYGVHIEQFGFIGAPRPPEAVIAQINSKVQAQQIAQQKQTELLQAQADAQKQIAAAEGDAKANVARAQGEAEANRVKNASITSQLLEWKKQENQAYWISKWNGETPKTVVGGERGATPLISLPQ